MPRCFIVCTMWREAVTLTTPIALSGVFQTRFESGRTEKNSFLCQDTNSERPAVSQSLQ